ncbi:MAG: ABC transporter-like protein [Microgenomates group bacterium Gr01-1014_16]|nr:MAG: ABC transporter-like protein [Microgenomates group bacterium Gr01-1014_16]
MDSFKRFFLTYRRILALAYRVNPSYLVLLTIISAFWGLTNLPILYINKILLDLVISSIGHPNWEVVARTIIWIAILRAGIEFARSFLSRYQNAVTNLLTSQISNKIEIMLGVKLNTLDIPTIESPVFQDKYKKVSRESNQRVWGMLSPLSDFPNAIFTIISGAIPLFTFNPLITLVIIAASLPEAFVSGRLAKLEYRDRDSLNKEYRIWGWISWLITDTRQIYENKLYDTANYVTAKLNALQEKVEEINRALRFRRVKWRTFTDVPLTLLVIGLNSYFFILALIGRITLGSAQMLYQAANTLTNGFNMVVQNIAVVYENYLFVQDFTWFMDLVPKLSSGTKILPDKLHTGIVFDHVFFKYPTSTDWVLKDVSLSINPTDNVAIVGENGAGKTTLLKLLLGLHSPQKGQILINGLPVHEYNLQKLWHKISVLQQDFHLFPLSARESIAFSDLSRVNNLSEVKQAAKLAEIDAYIETLPLKYETPLNKELEHGVDPSGGQKQRIGLARTMFRKSNIMILDEPTSNVDPKAEEEIFENVLKITRDQILMLVSHRFSTVRKADRILVLENGTVSESGSHEQLMKQKGTYSELFTLQAKSYQ